MMSKIDEVFPKVMVCLVFFLIAATIIYNADRLSNLAENMGSEASSIIVQKYHLNNQ